MFTVSLRLLFMAKSFGYLHNYKAVSLNSCQTYTAFNHHSEKDFHRTVYAGFWKENTKNNLSAKHDTNIVLDKIHIPHKLADAS